MARAPSIGAVPTQASAEMQQLLIAMKRAVEAGQTTSATQRAALLADIAALEATLTALDASLAATDGDVSALEARIVALETEIAEAADKDQDWEQTFYFEYPAAKDYRVVLKARVARTITNVVTRTVGGTLNVTVKINTTALGAGSAISASTSDLDTPYTTNNVMAQGDDIVITLASLSSADRLTVTLYGTYVQDTT